jgi:hypothetical protein
MMQPAGFNIITMKPLTMEITNLCYQIMLFTIISKLGGPYLKSVHSVMEILCRTNVHKI